MKGLQLLPGIMFSRGEIADTVADLACMRRYSVIIFQKGVSGCRMIIFQATSGFPATFYSIEI